MYVSGDNRVGRRRRAAQRPRVLKDSSKQRRGQEGAVADAGSPSPRALSNMSRGLAAAFAYSYSSAAAYAIAAEARRARALLRL